MIQNGQRKTLTGKKGQRYINKTKKGQYLYKHNLSISKVRSNEYLLRLWNQNKRSPAIYQFCFQIYFNFPHSKQSTDFTKFKECKRPLTNIVIK